MGLGFTSSQVPDSVAPILDEMRRRATERNQAMLARINAHLQPVSLDYERDVLPLTPAGTATERHMLQAYIQVVEKSLPNPTHFWAEKLKLPLEQVAQSIQDGPAFQNLVRGKLMKKGGVGYVQPGPTTFPSVEEFHTLIVACGALPCAAWLDGLSAGEQAIEELLELLVNKGVVALNIIPDRNWNIADPETKRVKLQKLYQVAQLAQKLDLPLNVGTEMNAYGQKFVDDFDTPELAPVRDLFLEGAYFIYGHTIAQRGLGRGYHSDWAQGHLPTRRERNTFYAHLGRQIEPGEIDPIYLEQLTQKLVRLSGRMK
jgi:hypothetical protein